MEEARFGCVRALLTRLFKKTRVDIKGDRTSTTTNRRRQIVRRLHRCLRPGRQCPHLQVRLEMAHIATAGALPLPFPDNQPTPRPLGCLDAQHSSAALPLTAFIIELSFILRIHIERCEQTTEERASYGSAKSRGWK